MSLHHLELASLPVCSISRPVGDELDALDLWVQPLDEHHRPRRDALLVPDRAHVLPCRQTTEKITRTRGRIEQGDAVREGERGRRLGRTRAPSRDGKSENHDQQEQMWTKMVALFNERCPWEAKPRC